MTNLIFFVAVLAVVVLAIRFFSGMDGVPGKTPRKYSYTRKQFFMTRAEHEFYNTLVTAVGDDYRIFAQVHLPTIVEHKVKGQNWKGAFSHVNGKSVDFVLCDKAYLSPMLAIELDDKTHVREDRIERDTEVKRILEAAEVPLLRIENHGKFDPVILKERITQSLAPKTN